MPSIACFCEAIELLMRKQLISHFLFLWTLTHFFVQILLMEPLKKCFKPRGSLVFTFPFPQSIMSFETLCLIWYHLYNFKNVKNTHGHGELLILVKVILLHGCYSRFWNFTNGAKLCNTSHLKIKPVIASS